MIERLIGGRAGLRFRQFVEFLPEQLLAGPEGDGLAGILLRHGFQSRLPGLFFIRPVGHVILQIAFAGILSGDLGLQGLVNLVVIDVGVGTAAQQMPQDILVVRRHEVLQGSAHQPVHTLVQGRIVSLAEDLGTVLHERPALIGGSAAVVAHPLVGHHRMVEGLHFLLQLLAEFLPFLPVTALHRLHVLCGGVVEIDGQAFRLRLRLDLGEDFRLLLGAVGLGGLLELFPQGGEHMAVLVGLSVHHRGCQ